MSGYTFVQIPQLKQALLKQNLQLALDYVPVVNIENDEWEYVALIGEFEAIFRELYAEKKSKVLMCFMRLVAFSEHIYYSEDWPQFTDLVSNILAVIAEHPYSEENEQLIDTLMKKLNLKSGDVIMHGNLNYNLACFFANKGDTKTMMEYVLRASFSLEKEQFFQEPCFALYRDQPFFRELLEKFDCGYATWWTDIWPIEDWYEESSLAKEIERLKRN